MALLPIPNQQDGSSEFDYTMRSTPVNGNSRAYVEEEWTTEPIAIIGLSCRFAGDASSTEGFWEIMRQGRNAWSEPPPSRWNTKGTYHPDHDRLSTTSVKGAHFLEEDPGCFDAAFFGYSGKLAAAVDPQYRLQLESAYEALENAGQPLAKVAGSKTSCHTAVMTRDYHDGILRDGDSLPRFLTVGTLSAMSANRISHFFDLRGTSFTLDTGCSGGIVALHQAVLGLRAREADMAIVSGCNLMISPDTFKMFSSLGMLSPDGISYAFDSRANGYGRGEGVGTLVLKRLRDALEAGDPIRAVIRESLLNQDGKTDSITQPSEAAQAQLMRDCYRRAGLDPGGTQYFEAHGTGTPTGDPIEARAIAAVFGAGSDPRRRTRPLVMGSVKTSIGHTEAASGLAAVIKVVLSMERDQIPPSINYKEPNRELRLGEWGIEVATKLQRWPAAEGETRRASINNFGFGGTNSHVIIEDGSSFQNRNRQPKGETSKTNGHCQSNGISQGRDQTRTEVLVFYARDEHSCQRTISGIKSYLKRQCSTPSIERAKLMRDLSFTLSSRRTRFPSGWVAAYAVSYAETDLGMALDSLEVQSRQLKPVRLEPRPPRIGMVFTGQGAQWHAMGRELMSYPSFQATLDEAQGYLDEFGAGWSLVEELMRDAATTRVNTTALGIPICVAVQVALVRLLKSWGIEPTAVASHSSGEIAASYAVGAMSLRQAMAAGHYRALVGAQGSSSSKGGPRGAMVALGVGQVAAERDYLSRVTVTVAGDEGAVEEVVGMAAESGVFARRLRVDMAYHSHQMMPLAEPYREALVRAAAGDETTDHKDKELDVIFSSPVTGGRVTRSKQLADPDHLVKSLVQPVEFVKALTDMVLGGVDASEQPSGRNIDVVIEVGPHTALGGPIKEIMALPEFQGAGAVPYMGCLKRGENARHCMLSLAAGLVRKGYPVHLPQLSLHDDEEPRTLTDLPPYPWNHGIRHWAEARVHTAYLGRNQAPHDLLGMPVAGANPEAAAWTQKMRVADHRWLEDHVVQGATLWPGAGFVTLAIEAVKQQLAQSAGDVAGFRLRQVEFQQALVVPGDDNGIEVQTTLRSVSDKVIGARGWKEFEVSSVTADGRWTQHAKGLITAEPTTRQPGPDRSTSNPLKDAVFIRRIHPEAMWAGLHRLGMCHGPMFQNTKTIVQDGVVKKGVRIAVTTIGVADCATECLLHPTTLDSVCVAGYAALPEAGANDEAVKIPRSIQNLWVSAAMPTAAGHVLACHTSLVHAGARTMQADMTVVDGSGSGPAVLEVEGLVYQSLGRSATTTGERGRQVPDLAAKMDWAPDLALSVGLPGGAAEALTAKLSTPGTANIDPKDRAALMLLRRVCVYFCHDATRELAAADVAKMTPQNAAYYEWMKQVLHLAASRRLGPDSDTWGCDPDLARETNIALARTQSVDGELIGRLGPLLAPMLRGDKVPLDVMAEDKLLSKYASDALRLARGYSRFTELLRAVAHKNPRARVLQIGAGAGEATHHALRALGTEADGGPFVQSWHVTDHDPSMLEVARAEFAARSRFLDMEFDVLDMEHEPPAQGFQLESYDLVVACRTLGLWASRHNVGKIMANIRSLMKPGAQLVLMETTQDQIDVQFIHGLLPGSALCPCLPVASWDRALKSAGFSGVDVALHDYEADQDMRSVTTMLASVPGPPLALPEDAEAVIVTSKRAMPPDGWLQRLRASIASVTARSLPAVQILECPESESAYRSKVCVFVGEIDQPLLINLDAAALDAIRLMATTCGGLVWVTRGGTVECTNPSMSLVSGFARVLRNEYVGRKFVTLDLDPKQDAWSESDTAVIAHAMLTALGSPAGASASPPATAAVADESELALRDGLIMVPRIYQDTHKNKMMSLGTPDWTNLHTIPNGPLEQPDRPLRLHVGVPGMLDSLVFDDDVAYDDYADDDTIEIEPRAYGVNFRDVMVALDQLRQRVMGVEVAGVISRLGSAARAQGFAVGDRVFGFLLGPFASRARIGWHAMARIPDGMSFEDAASLPLAFGTAYECLVNIARVQPGQSVLIHSAAGGVGQAAIMLAKDYLGCEIYATCGSQEKREFLMQTYGLPAERIFTSRDASFGPGILAATAGRGVDVVLNSLAGPLLQASFDVLAPFGHMVEMGKRDLEDGSLLDMAPFSRGVSYSSLDMVRLLEHRRAECHRLINDVARLVGQGIIKPLRALTVYPISDIAKAFQLLQTGKHMGKVVLSVAPDQQVKVLPRVAKPRLKGDASYLIVGGVGGIGRSVAFWMASHGAKNIVVLSRSAGSAAARSFVAGLGALGCRVVALSCDVASEKDLSRALRACESQGLPPIRGVVHGAMVLQDSILENMTIGDWNAALGPKVAATWNLHSCFSRPDSLDFFVMLSSLSAIFGWASQSNYAAGGAYEDAVACFRVARGLPAVSVDLGIVVNVGNEALFVTDKLAKSGQSWLLTDDLVMQALGTAILEPFQQPQLLYGLNPGPGPHWDAASSTSPMGREALFLPLRYRKPAAGAGSQTQGQDGELDASAKPLSARLQGAGSLAEAKTIVGEAIVSKLAEIFVIPSEDIDMTQPPASFGVDSLVAVELRNMLMLRAAADMPIFNILQSASLVSLASDVASKSAYIASSLKAAV
ncbi:putative polyketide synthase [Stachybotrys elegans]|uniref:Polyketide synthase n=1 Tax=Stachybotrys elegans TaxID=80388 RepID=A0A8K0SJY0_9HYPO|nr:putative polyketide synthase [Stachybotrys elegans]